MSNIHSYDENSCSSGDEESPQVDFVMIIKEYSKRKETFKKEI